MITINSLPFCSLHKQKLFPVSFLKKKKKTYIIILILYEPYFLLLLVDNNLIDVETVEE